MGSPPLPRIPSGTRFHPDMLLGFVRYPSIPGGWYVQGPAGRLVPGETVEVVRFGGLLKPTRMVSVVVGEVVAERMVQHRTGSPARYVLVTFSKVDEEAV